MPKNLPTPLIPESPPFYHGVQTKFLSLKNAPKLMLGCIVSNCGTQAILCIQIDTNIFPVLSFYIYGKRCKINTFQKGRYTHQYVSIIIFALKELLRFLINQQIATYSSLRFLVIQITKYIHSVITFHRQPKILHLNSKTISFVLYTLLT